MWQCLQVGIWRGCDLPFPGLQQAYYYQLCGILFCQGLGRCRDELLASCWLSLPDPTHIKLLLFAMGLPRPVQRVGGLGSELFPPKEVSPWSLALAPHVLPESCQAIWGS